MSKSKSSMGWPMDSSRTFSRLNASAARALLACLSKNVVDAHDVVIVYQQPRLCQFLLAVANGSIVGSVEQFDGGDGRDAAQLVVLHTELAHVLVL